MASELLEEWQQQLMCLLSTQGLMPFRLQTFLLVYVFGHAACMHVCIPLMYLGVLPACMLVYHLFLLLRERWIPVGLKLPLSSPFSLAHMDTKPQRS